MSKPQSVEVDVPPLTKQEHIALKALAIGEASQDQQTLALEVITKKLSRAFDMSYIPGSTHGSAFLAGRMFVGQQIVKYLNLNVSEK